MSALRIARPGMPTEFVYDLDPYTFLTQRQRHILEVVRANGGNRSRAARELGINTAAVQASLRVSALAGVTIPRGVTRIGIPNRSKSLLGPRCSLPMRSGVCGRPAEHPNGCVSTAAWRRRAI